MVGLIHDYFASRTVRKVDEIADEATAYAAAHKHETPWPAIAGSMQGEYQSLAISHRGILDHLAKVEQELRETRQELWRAQATLLGHGIES